MMNSTSRTVCGLPSRPVCNKVRYTALRYEYLRVLHRCVLLILIVWRYRLLFPRRMKALQSSHVHGLHKHMHGSLTNV